MNRTALQELMERNHTLANAAQDTASREAREARIAKAETDFTFFCEHYLPDYFFCKPAEYQRILYDVIQSRELTEGQAVRLREIVPHDFRSTFKPTKGIKGVVDVEPRQHGKSTRMTFAFPLWCLLFRKAHFILIIGASKDDAELQMDNVRQAIENNDRILEDFGLMAGTPWNKGFLKLSNGTAAMAKGKGGSLRGRRNQQYRPDLIIVDDTLKDDESDSGVTRDKVCRWFNRTIQPLGTDALIVVVNTITNEDDLPSRLLADIRDGRKKNWIGLRFSAEIPAKGGQPHGTPLWPERYSWDELKRIQENIGSVAYAIEFLSRPLSDEDRLFKRAWIKRVRAEDIPVSLSMYEGVDPATGAHDMSAVVDVGVDRKTGIIYVVGSNGRKESPQTFKERLFQRYRRYRYRRCYMEAVAFQTVFKDEIVRDGAKEGLRLPIRGVNPGRGSKSQRLMALSPLVENQVIQFGPGNEDLIDQLVGFPAAGYDDLCDALDLAVKASRKGGGGSSSWLGRTDDRYGREQNIRRRLNI